MYDNFKLLIKQVLFDKVFLSSIVALIAVVVIFCVILSIGIKPSDLQVSIQYTAYGDAHFYRGSWLSLLTFVLFAIITAICNIAVAVKLFVEKGRNFAIVYVLTTIVILMLSGSLLYRVVSIAALS